MDYLILGGCLPQKVRAQTILDVVHMYNLIRLMLVISMYGGFFILCLTWVYPLYLLLTLHPHVGGVGWHYLLFLEAPQLWWRESLHHISILGWIFKS